VTDDPTSEAASSNRMIAALLLQSILMIAAQIFLLSLLIKYKPGSFASSSHSVSSSDRPGTSDPAPAAGKSAPQRPPSSQRSDLTLNVSPPTPPVDQEGPVSSNLWKNVTSSGTKGYAPLLDNFSFPPPPVLAYEEGEDEEESAQQATRMKKMRRDGGKAVRFLQAGLRIGDEKRLDGSSGLRPFGFWTWQTMQSYYIFLGLLVVFLAFLQLLLGYFSFYTALLGYFALGLESTLPIPQAIANQKRRSLSGFRWSVLAGWVGGDLFKTIYFIAQASPIQFTVCALFQLSVDFVICAQVYFFREKTAQDDENQRLSEAEALEAGQAHGGESEASLEESTPLASHQASSAGTSNFRIEADDDDEDLK
jgi:hypothetical protein